MATDLTRVKMKTLGTNEQPPAGYVCLGERWPAEGINGRDRERIRKGIVSDGVDAYRHVRFEGDTRGNIYVHLAQATGWLASYDVDGEPANQRKVSTNVDAQSPSQDAAVAALASALSAVCTNQLTAIRLLERVADALESMATQPKTPQQELLHTFSSNGFHS
jgi:hypothetical protein